VILVDDREGSKQLVRYFPKPITHLVRLPFGDVAFLGKGPEGRPIPVGIEIKTLSEALDNIVTGRFAGHQLPGLIQDFEVSYLVVYGELRQDAHGIICVPRKGGIKRFKLGGRYYMWRDFQQWLITMELRGDQHIRFMATKRDVGNFILALYRWWTAKSWEEHRAHLALDTSGRSSLVSEVSLARRFAKELPGVGWGKSAAVERYFSSALNIVMADEKEWLEVDGIGKILARKIWNAIRGKEEKKKQGGRREKDL